MKKPLSPFHGYPATTQYIDVHGRAAFRVEPFYLTPTGARIGDTLSAGGVLWFVVFGVANLDNLGSQGGSWIAAIVISVLFITTIQALCRFLFKTHTRLELTNEHFIVYGAFRSKRFDRALPHKFTLIPHDKAEDEREQHLLSERQAQSRGQFVRKKKYYGDSYHLSYEYLGQRNDVLTVMGKKEALAIAARLKAIDDVLNANSGRSEGISLTPEDEWDNNSGDIE